MSRLVHARRSKYLPTEIVDGFLNFDVLSARASVDRQLVALVQAWGTGSANWGDPETGLLLADTLDVQLCAVIAKVALLRHEARRVLEARTGARQ